jgi:hypothetical protein
MSRIRLIPKAFRPVLGPFLAPFPPRHLLQGAPHPSCATRHEHPGPGQVPAHAAQIQHERVLGQGLAPGVQTPGLRLHPGKRVLDLGADGRHAAVAPVLAGAERVAHRGPLEHPVEPAELAGHGLMAPVVVGLVAEERLLVAAAQGLGHARVVHVGAGQGAPADQPAAGIHTHVGLVAEGVPSRPLGPLARVGVHLGVVEQALAPGRGDVAVGRGHHRGVDDRAAAHDQPVGVELAVDLLEELPGQAGLGQLVLELPEAGEVRGFAGHAQPQELAEAEPVVDLLLELRVAERVQVLQEQRPDHKARVVARAPALRARAVEPGNHACQGVPVQDPVDLAQEFGAAGVHALGEEGVDEVELGLVGHDKYV